MVEYGSARGRPFSRRVGSFTFTSGGDYRIEHAGEGITYTYDAEKRVARRCVFRDGEALYSEVARDLPDPGPFFGPWMGASQVLDRSVAAYARAVIAELDPDVPVTPVTWEGRTAWSITVPEPLSGGGDNGTARIVVDAQSGYPLAVEHWSSDGEVSGTRIENVRVGGNVPRSRFTVSADVKDKLLPMSERFRRMSLRQAAALGARATTSFTPYAAGWVPRGYRLSGVTGAVNGAFLGAYGPVREGEVGSLTVVLTYRRGFDRFCIVSRWRQDNPPGSDDPFDENSVALSGVHARPAHVGQPARRDGQRRARPAGLAAPLRQHRPRPQGVGQRGRRPHEGRAGAHRRLPPAHRRLSHARRPRPRVRRPRRPPGGGAAPARARAG